MTPISSFDLPPYLEPEAGSHAVAVGGARPDRPVRTATTLRVRPATLPPGFIRLFPIPRDDLARRLSAWWSSCCRAGAGTADVHGLRLQVPVSVSGGWHLPGHMVRPGRRRPVPVLVGLWPTHADWTRVTMDPEVNVTGSAQWFRDGHLALERFVAELNGADPPDDPLRWRPSGVAREG